jgi:hypothetical protein
MGRLDPSVLRYLTKEDFRILQAIGSRVAMHARFHSTHCMHGPQRQA